MPTLSQFPPLHISAIRVDGQAHSVAKDGLSFGRMKPGEEGAEPQAATWLHPEAHDALPYLRLRNGAGYRRSTGTLESRGRRGNSFGQNLQLSRPGIDGGLHASKRFRYVVPTYSTMPPHGNPEEYRPSTKR